MRLKKVFCLLLAGILTFACLTMNAGAVQTEANANTLAIRNNSNSVVSVSGTVTY